MQELLNTTDTEGIIEGRPATALLSAPSDAVELIGACFSSGIKRVLLYDTNLTPRFFDLSSGDAGEILQKLRNYGIRLAVVVSSDGRTHSRSFREMVSEESHGGDFRMFDDRAAAVAWLLSI